MKCCGFITNYGAKLTEFSQKQLQREIEDSIEEGYDTFITCMLTPADKQFMTMILEAKEEYKDKDIKLEGVIPYSRKVTNKELCSKIHLAGNKNSGRTFFLRNREMSLLCDKVIALHEPGSNTATGETLRYAYVLEKVTVMIDA